MILQRDPLPRNTDQQTLGWATPAQQHAVRYVVGKTGFSPSLAATVAALSAPTVDVAALAAALQQTLAPEIVKALGQKLAQ